MRAAGRGRAASALLAALVATGCAASGPREDKGLEASLTQAVARPGRLDLAAATRLPWDRLVVVGGHAGQSGVDDALGFHFDAGRAAPVTDDDENLLLFVRARRVVAFVEDFRGADLSCLPRSLSRRRARSLRVLAGRGADRRFSLLLVGEPRRATLKRCLGLTDPQIDTTLGRDTFPRP